MKKRLKKQFRPKAKARVKPVARVGSKEPPVKLVDDALATLDAYLLAVGEGHEQATTMATESEQPADRGATADAGTQPASSSD